MRSDLQIADKPVIVIAYRVKNTSPIDSIIQNDLITATEVSVKLEVGEVPVTL